MGRSVVVAVLAVLGLFCAAGMGYASYLVSRGSVAVPVTRLQPQPRQLTPTQVRARPERNEATTRTATTTRATTPGRTTTVDDHGGRRGGGGDNSGRGGGGGGGGHGRDD